MSWEETFFFPDLPMVLKEVCPLLFLTKALFLLTILPSVMCTRVLKGVNLCMLLSTALCTVSWGLERSVLIVLFTADLYPIYMQGLEMSQILWLCPLVGPLLTVLAVESFLPIHDLKWLSFPHYWVCYSYARVLKGVKFVSFPSTWTAIGLSSASGPSTRNSSINICNLSEIVGCCFCSCNAFIRPNLILGVLQ